MCSQEPRCRCQSPQSKPAPESTYWPKLNRRRFMCQPIASAGLTLTLLTDAALLAAQTWRQAAQTWRLVWPINKSVPARNLRDRLLSPRGRFLAEKRPLRDLGPYLRYAVLALTRSEYRCSRQRQRSKTHQTQISQCSPAESMHLPETQCERSKRAPCRCWPSSRNK